MNTFTQNDYELLHFLKEHEGEHSSAVNKKLDELINILTAEQQEIATSPEIMANVENIFFKSFIKSIRELGIDTYGISTCQRNRICTIKVYIHNSTNFKRCIPKHCFLLVRLINKYSKEILKEIEEVEEWPFLIYAAKASIYRGYSDAALAGIYLIASKVLSRLIDKYKLHKLCNLLTQNLS